MQISDIHNPWRDNWRQASFRGAPFFVEIGAKGGGRRTVVHEFPKRDTPYAEDMGRRAGEFNVIGYTIGPNYKDARDALEKALDTEGAGTLIMPTRPDIKCNCLRYNSVERRQEGGFCLIEMTFVEAGSSSNASAGVSTSSQVTSNANNASKTAIQSLNNFNNQQ